MTRSDDHFGDGLDAGIFIDADNVDADVIEFAFEVLRMRGLRATMRRAYGGYERLGAVKDVCAAHAVKSLANHGKSTTDALLIVDVMDLLHGRHFPDVVAIASADADFAPLAVRLREAGCHTLCFAHPDKADAEALKRAYDEVHFLQSRRRAAAAPAAKTPARKAPAKRIMTAPAAEVETAGDKLEKLLGTVPGLRSGKPVELNEVVTLLRREGLLGKTASGPKFLAKNARYLRLTPEKQPNKAQWIDPQG